MKLASTIIRYVLTWPAFVGWLFPILFGWACHDYRLIGDGVLAATWRDWVLKPRTWLRKNPGGAKFERIEDGLNITWRSTRDPEKADAGSWWRYSTTISRGMILQPGASPRLIEHERVHVRQVEDLLVLSLLVSVAWAINDGHGVESWLEHIAVWTSGVAWQLPNFLTAGLRHGIRKVYRRSSHEDHAYALTNKITRSLLGKSWEEIFAED